MELVGRLQERLVEGGETLGPGAEGDALDVVVRESLPLADDDVLGPLVLGSAEPSRTLFLSKNQPRYKAELSIPVSGS